MSIVRELLFSSGNNDNDDAISRRYNFKFEHHELKPTAQQAQWILFLTGCFISSIIMRLYAWLLGEICRFSGDSFLTLLMGMTAFTGADAYLAGNFMSPVLSMLENKSTSLQVLLTMTVANRVERFLCETLRFIAND